MMIARTRISRGTFWAVIGVIVGEIVMIGLAILLAFWSGPAWSHEWFPADCCSGFDCRVVPADHVKTTARGFVIPGNPEVVPYNSPKIRQTPPEGEGAYAVCTKGGAVDGAVICLYIPTWGS